MHDMEYRRTYAVQMRIWIVQNVFKYNNKIYIYIFSDFSSDGQAIAGWHVSTLSGNNYQFPLTLTLISTGDYVSGKAIALDYPWNKSCVQHFLEHLFNLYTRAHYTEY